MEFPEEKSRGAPPAPPPAPSPPMRRSKTGLVWRIPVLALGLWILGQYGRALLYDADDIFGYKSGHETVVGSRGPLIDWDDVSL